MSFPVHPYDCSHSYVPPCSRFYAHLPFQLLFVNCDTSCRVELLRGVDGVLSQSSAAGALAWVGVSRPVTLWTYDLSGLSDVQVCLCERCVHFWQIHTG